MPADWSPLDTASRGRRPWFGRKRVGHGWSPRTWPGYLITTIVIVVIEAIAFALFGLKTAARRRR